ncbi:MAG TPA: tRNA pseudouridine(38-40) synthase TruA [Fimbriimonadaceae bacterium]
MTRRIKFVVAYDGTDFRGWAAQTGLRTVQSTLTEAVRRVSGEDCEIVGASRTDSGAHAKGQVCHFDTGVPIKPDRWVQAVNRVLPLDLSVVSAHLVSKEFNSRFCAIDRHYRYRFLLSTRDPLRARFSHFHWEDLDFERMQAAGKDLVGLHDFRGFTEELDPTVENTMRRLFSVDLKRVRDEIWLDVVGTAFLRGMMRRMAGILFEIGRGIRPPEDVERVLTNWQGMHLAVVLPARGLTLIKIRYGRHPRDHRDVEVNSE